MAAIASPLWTCRNVARLPEPRASSAIARPYATFPPGAVILLTEGATREPELSQARQKVERELGLIPVLGCRRDDLLVNKGAYPVSDLLLLLNRETSDVDEIYRVCSLPDRLGCNGHVVT